jgi:hypothetical protein
MTEAIRAPSLTLRTVTVRSPPVYGGAVLGWAHGPGQLVLRTVPAIPDGLCDRWAPASGGATAITIAAAKRLAGRTLRMRTI